MKLTDSQIKMMQEDMCAELVIMLMEKWGNSMEEALDVLYNSETFIQLQNPATGLYYQSPGYIYTFLENELTKGEFK